MARSLQDGFTRWALISLLVGAGCGGSTPAPEVGSVTHAGASRDVVRDAPEWVMRTPKMSGKICAVGAVDPTFYRQDGLVNAGKAARAELARSVQVKITSVMVDFQSTNGSHVDQSFVEEVVGSVSDVVVSGAQVMESWFDARGAISRQGMTYALACMPTDQSVAELADRLQSAAKTVEDQDRIQQVRQRAEEAFAELEKNENKQAGE